MTCAKLSGYRTWTSVGAPRLAKGTARPFTRSPVPAMDGSKSITMAPPPSGLQFMSVARKTLSRDNDDTTPIPNHYLLVLAVHLAKYPHEDNFLLDLDDEGGILTCLDCYVEVVLAVNRELKDFAAFWVSPPPQLRYSRAPTYP